MPITVNITNSTQFGSKILHLTKTKLGRLDCGGVFVFTSCHYFDDQTFLFKQKFQIFVAFSIAGFK